MKTQRILAPVDGSDLCCAAIKEADDLAMQNDGDLTLMFVHAPAMVHLMDDDFPEPAELTRTLLATARKILEKLAQSLKLPEERQHVLIETGSPAQIIIEHSADCDLIVMATHGHTGIKHVHLGSVTERVVRGSHCDVLIVKHPCDTDE